MNNWDILYFMSIIALTIGVAYLFNAPLKPSFIKTKNPSPPPILSFHLNNKTMSYSNQKDRVEAIEKLALTQKLLSEVSKNNVNDLFIEVIKNEIELIKKAQKDV